MSTFRIYGSGRLSLQLIGQLNNFLYVAAVLSIAFLMMFSLMVALLALSHQILMYAILGWVFLFLVYTIFSIYAKQALHQLGTLEVSKEGITKSIGSYVEFFEYNKIEKIRIRDHLKGIMYPGKYRTYLVTLTYRGIAPETFVVGARSPDDKPGADFEDFLKVMSYITGTPINITE
ncbi:hypothetical protein [Alkaliflexus imshenetskii]|uniref:hypothetical protein n=1 Tax=Alkaliflexus imshenetskii TaxID=286730 RepID=UPI00047D1AF7|nr:hypothetical protein [Alkaliflexus imshenetskii]